MDLILLKSILLIIMIVGTLAAGLFPMRLLRFLRRSAAHASSSQEHKHVSLVLCLLTCFSGGVFLATCFLHLFPELEENIQGLDVNYNWHVDYPLAELLSCLGFFFLFFLEELVIMVIPSLAHFHSHGPHGHGHGHAEHTPLQSAQNESGCCMTGGFVTTQQDIPIDKIMKTSEVDSFKEDEEDAAGHCQKHCPLTVHHVRSSSGRDSPDCGQNDSCQNLLRLRGYGSTNLPETAAAYTPQYRRCISEGVFAPLAVAEPERCETNCKAVDEDPPILMKSSPHAHSHGVRSITLVLALSIHSIIEGIALGVGNNASETTALFLSLMVHKLIVAFSVGLQLSRTHAHQLGWVIISILLLSLMSPFGAVFGMILQSATDASFGKDFSITIVEGMAVGTFLYVTFFEVLLHERDNEHPNMLKLLFIMIGFGLIGLLRLFDNHDHHHDHQHDHMDLLSNATSLHALHAH